MLRAAAKNFLHVLPVVDPADYNDLLDALRSGDIPIDWRRKLAVKTFQHVATYDTIIATYLRGEEDPFPDHLTIALTKKEDLRYGENPHQLGASTIRSTRASAPGAWSMPVPTASPTSTSSIPTPPGPPHATSTSPPSSS
jgi:AICAR transformylase/IMP cyclohydrolase PurH